MDNMVSLEASGKSQRYRCIMCALADAKGVKGDLAITAASDRKGEPVRIARTNGKWSISPPEAVFAYSEGSHEQCQNRYRAILSRNGFAAYARNNHSLLGNSKPLTLVQMLAKVQ